MAVRIVKHALEIIHLVTGKNPLQVVADAVAKSGPREDSTRIGSAGVVRRQAVDVSPLRRVCTALQLMTQGVRACCVFRAARSADRAHVVAPQARQQAFRNLKSVAECLADEIINAANDSQNSYAIKKKDEIERVAKANR
jgi:small subunit ribosomal protein S5e